MAILGTFDAKAMGTDVGVINGDATVTTTGDFTDAADNKIDAGDIIELSGVAYLVKEVTDANNLELHTTYAGSTGTVSAASAVRRTAPKAVAEYVIKGGDSASYQLLFADSTAGDLSENDSRGIWGPGWRLYRTHTSTEGTTRHISECLAPMSVASGVSGDDDDDALVADVTSTITISAQPPSAFTAYYPNQKLIAASVGSNTTIPSEANESYTITGLGGVIQGGSGVSITLTRDGGGSLTGTTVVINDGGTGLFSGDFMSVLGSLVGGTDGVDDVVVNIDSVGVDSYNLEVTASASVGSVTYQWQVQEANETIRWDDITAITGYNAFRLQLSSLTNNDNGKKYRCKLTSTAGAEEVISDTATLTVA